MRIKRAFLQTLACFAAVCIAHAADDGGARVVRQMHAKYQNAWFATTEFAQKTTTYDADGKPTVEQWFERIQLPGKLRIDVGPLKDGNAMILNGGRMYTFRNGSQVDSRPMTSIALLLGFDVYRQSPEITVAQLTHEGVDMHKVHEESWEGRPVVVVGANSGDMNSSQFWIDRQRKLLVRIIAPSRTEPQMPSDIRFLNFKQQARGMIAARIDVYRKDKLVMSEEYSDIQTDIPLDEAWFDSSNLSSPATVR